MDAIDSGHSESRVADVRLNDACEFGKWLASLPLTERLTGHYKQVSSLHAEFHVLASNILELALSGRTAEATSAMALGSRFAAVSSQLTMAVLAWKERATGGEHAGTL
jgi:hypothetical protein